MYVHSCSPWLLATKYARSGCNRWFGATTVVSKWPGVIDYNMTVACLDLQSHTSDFSEKAEMPDVMCDKDWLQSRCYCRKGSNSAEAAEDGRVAVMFFIHVLSAAGMSSVGSHNLQLTLVVEGDSKAVGKRGTVRKHVLQFYGCMPACSTGIITHISMSELLRPWCFIARGVCSVCAGVCFNGTAVGQRGPCPCSSAKPAPCQPLLQPLPLQPDLICCSGRDW